MREGKIGEFSTADLESAYVEFLHSEAYEKEPYPFNVFCAGVEWLMKQLPGPVPGINVPGGM